MSKVLANKSLSARPHNPARLRGISKGVAAILAISMAPLTAQSTPPDMPGPNAQGYIAVSIGTINAASAILNAVASNAAAATQPTTFIQPVGVPVNLATTAVVEASASSITSVVTTAYESAVSFAVDSLAQSAAANVGTTPYEMNFGGAQRDSIAGVLAGVKMIISGAIAISGNYSTTTTGKFVIGASVLASTAAVDTGRFFAQEYIKAWLINRRGFTTEAAAWLSFAAAQGIGFAFSAPIGYATQWGVAQYFTTNTNQRRRLLSEANSTVTNAINAFHRGAENLRQSCESSCGSPDCSILGDHLSHRESIRKLLEVYDDVLPTWQGEIPRTYVDAYPAQSSIGSVARADLKPIFDAIYKTRISSCSAQINRGTVGSSNLEIKCPYSNAQYVQLTLNPLSADAQGNVVVTRQIRDNRTHRVKLTNRFTINRSKIDTANYR